MNPNNNECVLQERSQLIKHEAKFCGQSGNSMKINNNLKSTQECYPEPERKNISDNLNRIHNFVLSDNFYGSLLFIDFHENFK